MHRYQSSRKNHCNVFCFDFLILRLHKLIPMFTSGFLFLNEFARELYNIYNIRARARERQSLASKNYYFKLFQKFLKKCEKTFDFKVILLYNR